MSEDSIDPRLVERLARAARAAQILSETLWEALHEELVDPRKARVTELSARLAEVSMVVASLARMESQLPAAPARPRGVPAGEPMRDAAAIGASRFPAQPSSSAQESPREHPGYGRPSSQAPDAPPAPSAPPATRSPPSVAVLVDELAPAAPGELGIHSSPEIQIRDVRGVEGPAAWIGSIGRRLERHAQDRLPFAVLLVELVDLERLRGAESRDSVSQLAAQVEDRLARELRPADSLTRESPGRYWLLAPQTDLTDAQILADRIARAVRSSSSHRGTPLEVAVGIAVCPEDGCEPSELAAHADVGLYAARAAGRPR